MKFPNRVLLGTLAVLAVLPPGRAQTNTAKTDNNTVASPEAETQKQNMQAYT